MDTPPVFRERIVVFLDILGFASLVSSASSAPDSPEAYRIDNALRKIQKLERFQGSKTIPDYEIHLFSDSVIISIPTDKSVAETLFLGISIVVWDLMRIGIWTRGGIAVGLMSVDKDRPWGPAIIDAYRTENSVANYPRFALSASAVKFLVGEGMETKTLKHISRDEDGIWSLDVFRAVIEYGSSLGEKSEKQLVENAKVISRNLNAAHDSVVDNPNTFKKLEWLCGAWDRDVYHSRNSKHFIREFDLRTSQGRTKPVFLAVE